MELNNRAQALDSRTKLKGSGRRACRHGNLGQRERYEEDLLGQRPPPPSVMTTSPFPWAPRRPPVARGTVTCTRIHTRKYDQVLSAPMERVHTRTLSHMHLSVPRRVKDRNRRKIALRTLMCMLFAYCALPCQGDRVPLSLESLRAHWA